MRLQDVHYALRGLRRSPGFTVTAVVTLALGIGANTAIFSILNTVLLRPLPFYQPGKLAWGWGKTLGTDVAGIGPPPFRDYRAQNRTFEQFAAMEVFTSDVALTGEGTPEQVKEGIVSSNFFDTLGLRPDVGRSFIAADERQNLPQVVILARSFWQRRFGGSSTVVGKSLILDGYPITVAGVLPDAPLLMNVQVFVPMPMLNSGMTVRRSHFLRVIGRIKANTTLTQAQADLDAIAEDLGKQYPDSDKGWSVRLQPLSDVLVGPMRNGLLVLMSAVGLVLLIGCANLANLLLIRATAREKEIAVRSAVGASRSDLVWQFLTESMLLALMGGAVALLLAAWGVAGVRTWGPADLPRLKEIDIDGAVLGFTALLSIGTGILFGLGPAFAATRGSLQPRLKGDLQRGSQRGGGGLLVTAELAVSLVLLLSAGLALKSLWNLVHVDPGFRAENTVTASLGFPVIRKDQPQRRIAFLDQLLQRITALPGVRSAGAVSELPMTGTENDTLFRVEGKTYAGGHGPGSSDMSIYHRVAGDYFQTMGIPLRRGRFFGRQDAADSALVAVINEPFARRFFPGGDPIGKRLLMDEGTLVPREIVGVVGGARYYSLASPPVPEMYVPYSQAPSGSMNLAARTSKEIAGIGAAMRGAVASLNRDQPVSDVRTLEKIVSTTAAQPRFYGLLLALFAAMAVLLATVGIYGVISYAVSRRTREIGIRMALGASPKDVFHLVAGQSLRFVTLGVATGLCGAYLVGRLLASRLYQVTPHDALIFIVGPLVLATVTLAACWIPTRRAMRVDPVLSLRQE